MVAFCPDSKSLSEANVRRFRVTALAKEISKDLRINFVVWLLNFKLMKNILMKIHKMRKKKSKMYGSSIKWEPGSEMELNSAFKRMD